VVHEWTEALQPQHLVLKTQDGDFGIGTFPIDASQHVGARLRRER
jgi:hypothetical protein